MQTRYLKMIFTEIVERLSAESILTFNTSIDYSNFLTLLDSHYFITYDTRNVYVKQGPIIIILQIFANNR